MWSKTCISTMRNHTVIPSKTKGIKKYYIHSVEITSFDDLSFMFSFIQFLMTISKCAPILLNSDTSIYIPIVFLE